MSFAPAPGGSVLAAAPSRTPEAVRIQATLTDALDGVNWPFKRGGAIAVTIGCVFNVVFLDVDVILSKNRVSHGRLSARGVR